MTSFDDVFQKELYPYYYILDGHAPASLTKDELEDYFRMKKEFEAWQTKLKAIVMKTFVQTEANNSNHYLNLSPENEKLYRSEGKL